VKQTKQKGTADEIPATYLSGKVARRPDRYVKADAVVEKEIAMWNSEDCTVPEAALAARDEAALDFECAPARSRFRLTPRQQEVLALMCQGLTNKHICRHLNITQGTVKAHVSAILRAIGASNRMQAALWAVRGRVGATERC
jgi:DNA-binding NarL/FixJ family response regulator